MHATIIYSKKKRLMMRQENKPSLNLEGITLEKAIDIIHMLLEEIAQLKTEVQELKDEVNRLKGEKGRPDIRAQSKKSLALDHSSEAERKLQKNKNKGKTKKTIKIDRQVIVPLNKANLPADAKFKGYQSRIIQDIKICSDNVEYKLESYYSRSLNKTFIAPMPLGCQDGEFGPGIKALACVLYRDSGMTTHSIERFLTNFEVQISHGTISSMLTEGHDVFHKEKEEIIEASRQTGLPQQLDDCHCRVNGKNHVTHVLCNALCSIYFTRLKKDRLTVLSFLCCEQLKFRLDEKAIALMTQFKLSPKWHQCLRDMTQPHDMSREEIDRILQTLFPDPKKYGTNRRIILEATALSYYQQSEYYLKFLMSDDAPQFNMLAQDHALCWVHEGRHYKKLLPVTKKDRKKVDSFLKQFWDYYHQLLAYKENPSEEMQQQLRCQFDSIFTATTGYSALDQRMAMTRAKKDSLLPVLEYPFLPLHNNAAELGVRAQVRIRDINFQTVSEEGTKCKDTFLTIVQTARKLGVNVYEYIYDRITEKFEMPSLAEIILRKALPT